MSKKPAAALNDDIGEAKRLELYRTQVVIREAEQRAYDLFLQNLVKGRRKTCRSALIVVTLIPLPAACRSRRCSAN
jgi:hypothetical protein